MLVLAAVAAALLVVAASAVSALLERSGPVRLRLWAEEAEGRLLRLHGQRERFNAFRMVLSLLAKVAPLVLMAALVALGLVAGHGQDDVVLVAAALTLLWLTLSELLNRLLVDRFAETALRRATLLYRALYWLGWPLVLMVAPWLPESTANGGDEDEDDASSEEIEAFIDFGKREGILEPEEEKMVWGIVDLGETQVKSVMTPRIDITCSPADADLGELAELFLSSGHSRIPLYEDSIDQIVGILHLRDALRGLRAEQAVTPSSLAKAPFIIPETKRLDELLKEMQAEAQQVAIVVDEYGGTAGLVTVEDLLEEIVGEISDEHEVEEPENEILADGSWRLDGRTHVEELAELLDREIEEGPFETLGGLILSALGAVPEQGQELVAQGLRLTVEAVENRRIQTVRVEPVDDEEEAEDD
ncbi:MAG: hemolysin family protein [Acidobacteriota bacterium]